jgi:hypothetical protein
MKDETPEKKGPLKARNSKLSCKKNLVLNKFSKDKGKSVPVLN